MQLVSIAPINFGPFSSTSRLAVEPKVTVLTGANDVGKSHVLRLIKKVCAVGNARHATEDEVNREFLHSESKSWKSTKVGAAIEWKIVTGFEGYVGGSRPGSNVTCEVNIATESQLVNNTYMSLREGGRTGTTINRWPRVTELTGIPPIGTTINPNNPNSSERQFLQIAFGLNFNWKELSTLSEPNFESLLTDGEDRLQDRCSKLLPPGLQFKFRLRSLGSDSSRILIQAYDALKSGTPIASRGDGARKLLAMLGHILGIDDREYHIIIADEPENSLHPEAQRKLRWFLEELAEKENVQVIYSTHSPVMINQQRLGTVRLVTRRRPNDCFATAEFDNTPYEDNLRKIRACLGVHPSDSLLYSDVAVVVEGDSECVCLPELLSRLATLSPEDFPDFATVAESFHLVNGLGDSFPKLCASVKGQGCRPIVFLDGDKQKKAYHKKLCEMAVPFASLPDGIELEHVVPLKVYLKAVADIANERELDSSGITEKAFQDWIESNSDQNIKRKMISKQVERWLEEQVEFNLPKAQVMLRAIQSCDPCLLLHAETFRVLFELIRKALREAPPR